MHFRAVYSITPVNEGIARGLAARFKVQPITPWDLPREIRDKILDVQRLLSDGEDPSDDIPFGSALADETDPDF